MSGGEREFNKIVRRKNTHSSDAARTSYELFPIRREALKTDIESCQKQDGQDPAMCAGPRKSLLALDFDDDSGPRTQWKAGFPPTEWTRKVYKLRRVLSPG